MPEKTRTRFHLTAPAVLKSFIRPRTIQSRLVRLVTLLVFIPSLAFIITSVIVGWLVGQQQAISQLDSVASLKQSAVEKWILDLKYDMVLELVPQPLGLRAKVLMNSDSTSAQYQEAYAAQFKRLNDSITLQKRFSEFLIFDSKGLVILSTNPDLEKKNFSSEKYFREGLKGVFISTPLYDLSQGAYMVVLAQPIVFEGETIGVFAGRASLQYLSDIMSGRAGLGQTGETYLVDSNFAALTPLLQHEFKSGNYVQTEATTQAIQNKKTSSGMYTGYNGKGVIGVYKWLPELQMALIAEQTQTEAFAALFTTLGINLAVTIIALTLAIWMAVIFGRNTGAPITHLANIAGQIASGDLSATAPVERLDEIGLLATAFNSMTSQLRLALVGLEERVKSRTLELETANQEAQKNAKELKIISEVSRILASEQNIDKLLPLITHLISDRFNFYHVGIFLLDDSQTYAVLRAANSPGGQRMLARRHMLEVGLTGIVGFVAQKGQPRIALDTGADAVFFNNPDLPDTHSEMALPLNLRGKIIGVLDVQSTQPAAFTEIDAATLSILAEQVAIAIGNARLFNETQQALSESQRLYQQFVSRLWEKPGGESKQVGYLHSLTGGQALDQLVSTTVIDQAIKKGELVVGSNEGQKKETSGANSPNIAVPIKLRDQIVGVLNVRSVENRRVWSQGELAMVQAISERVAFALENARLLEDSQRRAARERAIGEISTRISSAVDIDEILRATVDELGKKLRNSEVTIEIDEHQD